jgi:hypothetical protein
MHDSWLLAVSFACAFCGMSWLALAMEVHWSQVRGATRRPTASCRLRVAGAAALVVSLVVCLIADHPSMASLVWVMMASASALIVAMLLAYRPRWLSWLLGGR